MRLINIPGRVVRRLSRELSARVPDRVAIEWRYWRHVGHRLNLADPQTFDEKLHWLNLYANDPRRAALADKYTARSIVAEKLGADAVNELYGVWDRAADVPFESLPSSFVLKISAGCGWNIICPDKSKLNIEEARGKLAGWLATPYYLRYRERHYARMTPRIICERYLGDPSGEPPIDYKFFCFSGEPRFVQVDTDRYTRHARKMFDLSWRPAPFMIGRYAVCQTEIPRPPNLERMIADAALLSAGFPFARVDFYSIDGRTMFGEMTWFPAAGYNFFAPESYALELGRMIELPGKTSRAAVPVPSRATSASPVV